MSDTIRWAVIRWLSCDEYHAHSEEKQCFYYRALPAKDVEDKDGIVGFYSDKNAAEQAADRRNAARGQKGSGDPDA